jgi:hypothetical protein
MRFAYSGCGLVGPAKERCQLAGRASTRSMIPKPQPESAGATHFTVGLAVGPQGREAFALMEAGLLSSGPASAAQEILHFLQGDEAIFVSIHCLEDAFVRRLKLL